MSFEDFVASSEFKTELLELFAQFNSAELSANNFQSNSKVIKIVELSWNNVYKFSNKQYTLNFENRGIDHIAGLNASGKSSVIYILAYALFGGKYSSLPMTKDLVLNNENTDHGNITCEFYIDEDKYIISRTIMRKSTDKLSLSCNGKKIECDQNTLTQIFGDRELFLSIFCATQNHEYFVDKTVKAKYALVETLFGFESILENIKKFKSNHLYLKQLEKSLILVQPEFYETKISQIDMEIEIIKSRIDKLKSNEYDNSYKEIKKQLSMFINPTTIADVKSYDRIINIDVDIQKLKKFIPKISENTPNEYNFENIQIFFYWFDKLYAEASTYINEHKHFLLYTGFEDRDIKTELFIIANRISELSINLFGESLQLTPDNITKLNVKINIELEKFNNNADNDGDSNIKTNLYNLQNSITEYVNCCIEFVCSSTTRDNIKLIRKDVANYYRDLTMYYYIFKNLERIKKLDITDEQINNKITESDELLGLIKNMSSLMCEKTILEEKMTTNNKTIDKARTNKKELTIYEEYNNAIIKYKDALISGSYKSLQDNWNKELTQFFNSTNIKVSVEQSGEILITDFNTGNFISADVASGFQKFILDITFRVTMRGLITKTPYYNLLIIDEGFGVADDVNSKLIIPYLQSKSEQFKILVISHSTEFVNDSINQIEIANCEILPTSINKTINKKNNSIGDNCIISQNDRLTFTCKCCNIVLSNKSTAMKHISTKKHDLNYITFAD